jgi:hypothetical protein
MPVRIRPAPLEVFMAIWMTGVDCRRIRERELVRGRIGKPSGEVCGVTNGATRRTALISVEVDEDADLDVLTSAVGCRIQITAARIEET